MGTQTDLAEGRFVSTRGIRKKVKNAESVALKRFKVDNYILPDLDEVLFDVYCSCRPIPADYDSRKDLVKSLNAMALEIYGNGISKELPILEPYGSFVMDMFSSQSDLDVSINFGSTMSELTRDKKIQTLRGFAKKLRFLQGKGHVTNVMSILTARVPIVKFLDKGTAIECDLSVENKDGILNSQIIHIVSQIDDRFQKLCMLVKHWAKAHDVNSAVHRTLNSVSITFLVAFHLQSQDPPILPPFSLLFKDGIDPPKVEKRARKFLNWGRRNEESLGRLFIKFFIKLHSVEYLWRQGLCASVLNGLWISKKWKKIGIASISVEDFTDVSQNVARGVDSKGAQKIYSSINRTVEDVFEFLDGKINGTNLKQRLFGNKGQQPLQPPLPCNVYPKPQSYHGHREHHNKRVHLAGGYRAINRIDHEREEEYENFMRMRHEREEEYENFIRTWHEREEEYENFIRTRHEREEEYENLTRKRARYAGNYIAFEEEVDHNHPRFGLHNNYPVDGPYRELELPFNGPSSGPLSHHHRLESRFVGEEPGQSMHGPWSPAGLPRHYGPKIDPPLPPPYVRDYYYDNYCPPNFPEPEPYFRRPLGLYLPYARVF